MSADRLAILLALISLALGLILSRREPLKTALPFWIIPCAIIVGLLPRVLQLSDGWKEAGARTSLVLSLSAIMFLVRGVLRRRT
jgi:hypothetical protein